MHLVRYLAHHRGNRIRTEVLGYPALEHRRRSMIEHDASWDHSLNAHQDADRVLIGLAISALRGSEL